MRWAFGLACLTLSLVLKGCRVTENIEATINGPKRLGSFLAIGDWGWDSESHGNLGSKHCQQLVADAMHRELQNLGDVRFVINVGDSFYPDGVRNKSDPQWEEKWRQIYSPEVRGVPWYSVYGNHDYHADPCACSDDLEHCAQINGDITDLNFFFMPDFSWFKEHSDLDTEVIALDTNYYNWLNLTCPHTDCPDLCRANLRRRGEAALELFFRRVERSQASNLVVFSHYTTDYFPGGWNESIPLMTWSPSWLRMSEDEFPTWRNFLPELSNASRPSITYFGGHRHNVDTDTVASTFPHTNWVTGGGAGWSIDGEDQGFVVGEIFEGGKVNTYSVIVNITDCMS